METFKIVAIIIGVIGFILVAYPALIYIMFFCDETKPRLARLPYAHICVMIFNVILAGLSFATSQVPNGISMIF